MKRYEKKQVPGGEVRECTDCDLCGRAYGASGEAAKGFEVAMTEISCQTGYSCPDDSSIELIEVDLCPDCFKGRLIPWLRSQGAKIKAGG
jgi:hypothetical protein